MLLQRKMTEIKIQNEVIREIRSYSNIDKTFQNIQDTIFKGFECVVWI